jgi:hypothetical protein
MELPFYPVADDALFEAVVVWDEPINGLEFD